MPQASPRLPSVIRSWSGSIGELSDISYQLSTFDQDLTTDEIATKGVKKARRETPMKQRLGSFPSGNPEWEQRSSRGGNQQFFDGFRKGYPLLFLFCALSCFFVATLLLTFCNSTITSGPAALPH